MARGRIRIRATVHSGVLAHVDRLFGDDLGTIATELLRNAAQAGASRVVVKTDPDDRTVSVSDDGRGLAAARAATLLALGGTEGDASADEGGALAGVGFAALARRGASLRCHDWAMVATPATFLGEVEAVVETGLQWRRGFRVTFRHGACHDLEGRIAVRETFEEAAIAMPFMTVVDGHAVRRHRPIDAVMGPTGHWLADTTLTRTVGDCAVTVARFEDAEVASRFRSPYDRRPWGAPLVVTADLSGTVVRLDDGMVEALHPLLAGPIEGELLVPDARDPSRWCRRTPAYVVVVEAHGSETLRTRIADRQDLIRNGGYLDLGSAIVELVARLAAGAPRNGVPAESPLRALGSELGLRVPEAQVVVRRPRWLSANTTSGRAGHMREGDPVEVDPLMVVEDGVRTHRRAGLHRDGRLVRLPPFGPVFSMLLLAAERRDATARLVEADADVRGTDVAEAADLVVDGEAIPVVRDGRFDDRSIWWAWANSGRDPSPAVVGRLRLNVHTRAGRTLAIPLSFAIPDPSGRRVSSMGILLTRGATSVEVVEALVNASPWYEATTADGWATQLDRFRGVARDVVRGILEPPERRAAEQALGLARALMSSPWARELRRVTIAFGDGGARVTAMTADEAAETRTADRPPPG